MARSVITKKGSTIEGIPELKAKINALLEESGRSAGRAIGRRVKAVLYGEAERIAEDWRARVHVKSGRLRKAIIARSVRNKPQAIALVSSVFDRKVNFYATQQEYGGPHNKVPNPAFRQTVAANRQTAPANVAKGLGQIIEDVYNKS